MALPSTFGNAVAVTPSDTVNLLTQAYGIYVGGAGNVTLMTGNGAITFTGVPVGTTLFVRFTRVNSTGTTATNLVALY